MVVSSVIISLSAEFISVSYAVSRLSINPLIKFLSISSLALIILVAGPCTVTDDVKVWDDGPGLTRSVPVRGLEVVLPLTGKVD